MSNYPIWRKYAYEKEPDIKLLEKALENDGLLVDKEHSLKAIKLKYQAMTTEPTIIEKTMSPEQLFNARNPLWASGYTIQELYDWFKYRKPLDGYDRIDAIIKVSEKLNNAIKEQYNRKELK